MNRRLLAAVGLVVGLLAAPALSTPAVSAAPAPAGVTSRVNVATDGTQTNADSEVPTISGNGRYVAFDSAASTVVGGDTNGAEDVFVRDRVTGTTTRVSLATGGRQANGRSAGAVISTNGRYVAFESDSTNLVDADTNGVLDVFVHDRVTGATTRVSVATGGAQANGMGFGYAISGDGRYVTFESDATNLVAGDTNGWTDVFVHDRVAGTTSRVSVGIGGAQTDDKSGGPSITADGRYISFYSGAGNLVHADTNDAWDVFIRDRVANTTARVSVATDGSQGAFGSYLPAISGDGRYVAYESDANNLVAGDTNNVRDVFVRDRASGSTSRISVSTGLGQGNGWSDRPAISSDGRLVTFQSEASNLVANDTNRLQDVFVRDRVSGLTTRASVATGGAQATGTSYFPAISGDGRNITFLSSAVNLVSGDTNGKVDVFVRDRVARPATPFGDFNGDGWSDLITRQITTGDLWLYPGTGTGFRARIRIGTGWNGMTAITRHGDFSRDGHEDVIARDRAGALWLYPGTGTGFTARVRIGTGWNGMREIAPVGDLTGDGYPDVVAVQTSTGGLYLYPGHGISFGPRRLLGPGWNAMTELTGVGDLTGDGRPDLLARATATGILWLYPGTATSFNSRVRAGTGWGGMRDLTGVGDLDRDGHPDLLGVQTATGTLFLYLGQGPTPRPPLGSPIQFGTGWTGYRPLL